LFSSLPQHPLPHGFQLPILPVPTKYIIYFSGETREKRLRSLISPVKYARTIANLRINRRRPQFHRLLPNRRRRPYKIVYIYTIYDMPYTFEFDFHLKERKRFRNGFSDMPSSSRIVRLRFAVYIFALYNTVNSRYNEFQGTEEKFGKSKVRFIEIRCIKSINQQNSFLTWFKRTFRCRVCPRKEFNSHIRESSGVVLGSVIINEYYYFLHCSSEIIGVENCKNSLKSYNIVKI